MERPLFDYRDRFITTSADETLEIFAFMQAADESKAKGGIPVDMVSLMQKAKGF